MNTWLSSWLQLDQYVSPVRRQIARNLGAIGLLSFILVAVVAFNATFISPIEDLPADLVIIGVYTICGASILHLVRTGRSELAVPVIAFAILAGPVITFGYANDGFRNLNMYWLGIVVLGLMGSRRTVAITGGIMMAVWFITYFSPEASDIRIDGLIASMAIQFFAIAIAYIIAEDLRNVFEESVLSESTRRLRLIEINTQIATAIFSRHAIDDLLDTVVRDIQSQFELVYHAQVFLIDDDGRDAVLLASTGDVGRKLIEQGHKLGVGSQSVIGKVTREGTYVLAGDTSNDPVHRQNELLPETRTELALPLRVEGGVIGALDLQSRTANAFLPQDIDVFQTLADQIALAIDNAKLLNETRSQAEINEQLLRREQQNRQEIERLNRELTEQAWTEHFGVSVVQKRLDIASGAVSDVEQISTYVLDSAERGEMVIASENDQQIVTLPIKTNDVVVGALEFEIPKEQSIDSVALASLPFVAERVGLFAENARLFQQSQEALTEIERLYEMAQVINAAGDAGIDEIYQIVLDRLINERSLESVAVLLADPIPSHQTSNLIVDFWWKRNMVTDGEWSEGWQKGQKLDYLRRGLSRRFDQNPADVILVESLIEPRRHDQQAIFDIMSTMQAKTTLLVPLVSGERWFGLLICSSQAAYAFSSAFISFVQAAAGQLATTVENRRLLKEVQDEARRALALSEAGQLVTALSGGELADGVTRLFRAVSGPGNFNRWWFGLLNEDRDMLRVVSSATPPNSDLAFPTLFDVNRDDNALTELVLAPQPILVDSFDEPHPILGEFSEANKALYGRHLAVPVVNRNEELSGVLMIGRSIDDASLNERDMQLATTLANQLSIAIDNQELFRAAESQRQTLNNTIAAMPAGVVVFRPTGEVVLANDEAVDLLGPGIRIGMFAEDTYAIYDINSDKPHEPELFPVARALQQQQSTSRYNFYIKTERGIRRDVLISTALVANAAGNLISVVAIFQEITEIRELETALQISLSETTALYEASRSLSASSNKAELIAAIHEQLRPLEADRVYLLFQEGQEDVGTSTVLTSIMPPDPDIVLPTEDFSSIQIPRHLLTPDEYAIIVDDVETNKRFIDDDSRKLLMESDIRSFMSYPMMVQGNRVIGWIVVVYLHANRLDADERRFVSTLTDQAAISLNVNLLFESTQAALRSVANLYRASKRISEAANIKDAIQVVHEEVMNFSPDRVDLLLQENPDTPDVLYAAIASSDDRSLGDIPALPVDPITLRPQAGFDLLSSEAYFVEDLAQSADNNLQKALLALDTPYQSVISLPISTGGRILGRLSLGFLNTRYFASEERQFLEMLADSTAYVTENELLFQRTQDSLEETGVLYQASKAITAAQSRDDIVQAMIDYAASATVDKVMLISLVSEEWYSDDAQIEVVTTWGRGDFLDLQGLRFSPDQLPIWSQLSSPEIVFSDDVINDPDLDEFTRLGFATLDIYSYVIVPMFTPLGPLGAIMLGSSQPRIHREREIRIYQNLADQAAVQLQNKQLVEQSDARTRQLQISAEVTRSATEILDLNILFPRIVQLIKEAFNYDHAQIFMVDDRKEHAVLRAATGEAGEQMLAIRHSLPVGSASVVGQATSLGRYYLVNDTSEFGANHRPNSFLPETRAELSIPLIVKNEVAGAIDLQANQPGAFTEEDIATLLTLADQLAVAIDNAQVYELSSQRAEDMSFLFDVTSTSAAAAAGFNETLETLGTVLIQQMRASNVELFIFNEQDNTLESQMNIVSEQREKGVGYIFNETDEVIPLGHGFIGWVGRHQQSLIISDFEQEEAYFPSRADSRSGIFVPLTTGTNLIGVLGIEGLLPYQYDADDLILMQTLASTLSPIIQNARLVQELQATNDRLREIDQLKTNFLAAMSHELRTPLNSIIGFSRVILKGIDGPITEMQEQDIQTIHDQGKHLLGLVNDILDQAKIEAGKMELVKEYFDLSIVVKSLMSSAQGLTKDRPVQLFTEIETDLPEAYGDEFRTRQIILNILGNAAKFTLQGSITVSAYTLEDEALGRRMLAVSIADTGIGIAEAELPMIFESFQQVDNSTTRTAEGTGLGLPLARSLTELQGGRIDVQSTVGVGSTFTVYIPMEPEEVEDDATLDEDSKLATLQLNQAQVLESIQSKHPTSELKRRVILAVDDEVGMINLYRRYLSKEGWQIVGETDPMRTEEMIAAHAPQLILLDINMPNRDGWAVLEDLKKHSETSTLPVIICSIEADVTRSSQLGAVQHITKPFDESELVKAIRAVHASGSM